jgi:DNA-binding LytR/AlgR family response regulator
VRIAICDDESETRRTLHSTLNSCGDLPADTIITEFSDGAMLTDSHSKCSFDIIFLDIHMNGMSGLEAGRKIRDVDRNVIIIFLTNYKQHVFQSFVIEPFDYLIKPVDGDKLNKVLNRALKKHREQHYIVNVKWQDISYALKTCDIIYVESELRYVIFVTEDNRYKCVGKIDDFERRLAPYGFLRCHKGFLINMSFIKSINDNAIITTLGHDVYMSARRKQDCLKAFNGYLTKYRV